MARDAVHQNFALTILALAKPLQGLARARYNKDQRIGIIYGSPMWLI